MVNITYICFMEKTYIQLLKAEKAASAEIIINGFVCSKTINKIQKLKSKFL